MPKGSFCQLKYYDPDTGKTGKSDILQYSDKHQHGIQPSERDWRSLLPSVTNAVNSARREKSKILAEDKKLKDKTLKLEECDKVTWSAQ